MKKISLMAVAAMLMLNSCSQEKETISPSKSKKANTSLRTSVVNDCDDTFLTYDYNVSIQDPTPLLKVFIECRLKDDDICQPDMLGPGGTTTYGPIDIWALMPSPNFEHLGPWHPNTWDNLVYYAEQVGQDGFSHISYPAGATGAYISSYDLTYNIPSFSPFQAEVKVTANYRFCGRTITDQ